jgi:hypothetical protein
MQFHSTLPLSWQSGSEQDLRRLARAICHTEPDLFTTQEPVTAVFQAATENQRGGFLYVSLQEPHSYCWGIYSSRRHTSDRLASLCDLAFRLNPSRGTHWTGLPSDRAGMQREPIRILVSVEPPSAHDRAEALLTLLDWLDDRLHNPKKRVRAGLSPHPPR